MSPWHDTVHYLGIVGGILALLALLGGLIIYLVYNRPGRPFADPVRARLRGAHMALGLVAVGLALAHHFGRWAQEGMPNFGIEPPHLAGVFFLLVAVAGFLRYAPPAKWRQRWLTFAHLHRIGFVLAMVMMLLHTLYEVGRFTEK